MTLYGLWDNQQVKSFTPSLPENSTVEYSITEQSKY